VSKRIVKDGFAINTYRAAVEMLEMDAHEIGVEVLNLLHGRPSLIDSFSLPISRVEGMRKGLSESKRNYIFNRDNGICQYCFIYGVKMHVDHMTPWSRGGSDDVSNLCLSCATCNIRKSNTPYDDWISST